MSPPTTCKSSGHTVVLAQERPVQGLFEEIDALARDVALPKGTLLFGCGDPVSGVYVIRKGTISLFVPAPQDEAYISSLGPGSVIGLPASFNGYYSTGAEATEDSEAGFLAHDRLLELLEGNQALLLAATHMIAQETARIRGLITSACGLITSAWEIAGSGSAMRPRRSLQSIKPPQT
jgi:CRP-like cAMP-binding protein